MYSLGVRPERDPIVQRRGVEADHLRVGRDRIRTSGRTLPVAQGALTNRCCKCATNGSAVLRRDAAAAAVVRVTPAAQAERRLLRKLDRPDLQPHGDRQRRLPRRFGHQRPRILAGWHVRHVPRHPHLPDQSRQHGHRPAVAGAAGFGQRGGHRHALRRVGPLDFVHGHVRRQRRLRQIAEAQPHFQRRVRAVGQIQRRRAVLAPHGVDFDRSGRLPLGARSIGSSGSQSTGTQADNGGRPRLLHNSAWTSKQRGVRPM